MTEQQMRIMNRQIEIVYRRLTGQTYPEIAKAVGLSERTVGYTLRSAKPRIMAAAKMRFNAHQKAIR